MNGKAPLHHRLVDDPSPRSEADRRAVDLFRVPAPPPLGPARQARIAHRLAADGKHRPPKQRLWLAPALASLLLAGAVGAAVRLWRSSVRPLARPTSIHRDAAPSARKAHVAPGETRPVEAIPTVAPTRRSRAPKAPLALRPPIVEPESALGVEARLLATALAHLRQDHDPSQALLVLADYRRRFPRAALSTEATLAEMDARLALGQDAAALALLESVELEGAPRREELSVLRGELRAGAGRCQKALADFEAVLRDSVERGLVGRALFGRASCRSRTGEDVGARSDLERYLSSYPDGPFAAVSRRLLGR